jgi:hypothetical protein
MIDLRGDETTSLQAFDPLIAVRLADDASVFVALGSDLENGAQYLALILQNAYD